MLRLAPVAGDDGSDGDTVIAVDKQAAGQGERGEGGERRPLGGEAVEQVVLLTGESAEAKQDPGMPLRQRISEGGLGLAEGAIVVLLVRLDSVRPQGGQQIGASGFTASARIWKHKIRRFAQS